MVKKWIKGILNHPINIIKGNWYRLINKHYWLYYARYARCKHCKELEDTPIGEVCGLCGCPLDSKLRVIEEKCELDKWK